MVHSIQTIFLCSQRKAFECNLRGNFEAGQIQKLLEVVFGGGASKSRVWSQILADVLGIPVKVPVVKEASALGTAMLAGVGSGIYKDLDDAVSKVVRFEKTYQPNIENHNIYQTLFERWKKVYKAQLDLSDQKLTTYMWSAPGL
ncbi:MAG: FGGY-family carbohydrate kinase [Sphaerochaetaceae bacterium]